MSSNKFELLTQVSNIIRPINVAAAFFHNTAWLILIENGIELRKIVNKKKQY